MFEGRFTLRPQETFAANAAIFVLACVVSAPALASNISRIPCTKATETTLQDPIHVLVAEVVSNDISTLSESGDTAIVKIEIASSSSLLAPRAEAAIREAFKDRDNEHSVVSMEGLKQATVISPPMVEADSRPDSAADKDGQLDSQKEMNTKLPGISDDDLSRYKKRMYRRDI